MKNSRVLSRPLKTIPWSKVGRCNHAPAPPGTPHFYELIIDVATQNAKFRDTVVDVLLNARPGMLAERRPDFSTRELLRAARVAHHLSLGSEIWRDAERSILPLLLGGNAAKETPVTLTSRELTLCERTLTRLGNYLGTDLRACIAELGKLAAEFKARETTNAVQRSAIKTTHGGRPQSEQIVRELMAVEFLRQCGQKRPHVMLANRLQKHPDYFRQSRTRSARTLQKGMARWLSSVFGKDCPADQKLMAEQLIAWLSVLSTDILPHLQGFSSQDFQW